MQQPDVCAAVRRRFVAKSLELGNSMGNSRAQLPIPYMVNPTGLAWLLLAFPEGSEGDALKMFDSDAGEQQAGDTRVHKAALAGPAYEGVAVLAQGLLGPAPVIDSNGECSFVQLFFAEPGVCVDPRKWSVGSFNSRDQLMPVFLIHINAALHSDLLGEANRLKRKNSCLESRLKSQSATIARVREALRSSRRRAESKARDCLGGHRRMNVAELPQPETTLTRVDFESEEVEKQRMEAESGQGKARRTRGAGTSGEMGVESILVKLPGPKRKRQNPDGTSPGGLEWDSRVLLNAVLLYSLSHTSLRESGSAGMSFLSRLALEYFVKAQPLSGNQSRRIDPAKPLPAFKPISRGSVRMGVFALELAKNEEMIDFFRDCDVLNFGHDGTSVGPWSIQCVYLRGFKRAIRWTDGAGTHKLGADAKSMCLDLKGSGDKFQTQFLVRGEDGKPRLTSITAAGNLAAQLHQAGLYYIVTRHPSLTVVGDGGGDGSGKGNRVMARQNMAGENGIGHLMFLRQSAGDDGMKMLNDEGLYVPLYEGYGFDPLHGNISKPVDVRLNSVQRMLNEAMRAHRNSGAALSSFSSSSSDDEEEYAISSDDDAPRRPVEDDPDHDRSPKPIYDPLFGPQSLGESAVQPMSFDEFVLWDIGRGCPDLCLAATMRGVTEAMVAAVEELASIMRKEALALPVDPAKCTKISIDGFHSLEKGKFVADDAINLVLKELTHVLGGRYLCKGGKYTTGPVSPLIRSNRPTTADSSEASTEACYVIDSQNAQRLANCANRVETYAGSNRTNSKAATELADMVSVFRSRRGHTRQQAGESKVVFGPGSKLFAFTHLPGHYVSTEVENLGSHDASSIGVGEGAESSRNAVRITRADSHAPNPDFDGHMHIALHVTLRALGAIVATQEVDYFGLPLPEQSEPDCAFYILARLESWLTGEFQAPEQWHFKTRLLRCWTAFQAHRQLRYDGAFQDVWSVSLDKFCCFCRRGVRVPDVVTVIDAQAMAMSVPVLQRLPAYVPHELWERAISALPDAERHSRLRMRQELKRKLLDEVLKKASRQAELAYKPETRVTYRQLQTTSAVMAAESPPLGVRAKNTQDKWNAKYSDLAASASQRPSMANNPFRYFLMAEQDKWDEIGGVHQSGASEPSEKQGEAGGAGQGGASGENGGQHWRRLTNAFLIWCIRHRGQ